MSKYYSKKCMDKRKELKTADKVLERIETGCEGGCVYCSPEEKNKFKKDCEVTVSTFKKNLEKEKQAHITKGCEK
jgi:hypothetical protein